MISQYMNVCTSIQCDYIHHYTHTCVYMVCIWCMVIGEYKGHAYLNDTSGIWLAGEYTALDLPLLLLPG